MTISATQTGGQDLSYGQQLEDSMSDFVFGIFLFVVTSMLMWYVEKSAVRFAMILSRCQVATRALKNINVVNKGFEQRSVLVKGMSKVQGSNKDNTNRDEETGFVSQCKEMGNVVRQKRVVEMYQWVEHEKRVSHKGKSDTVTYSYERRWSETYHNSSDFHESGHHNPQKNPNLESRTKNATTWIGAFELTEAQVGMMSDFSHVQLSKCPFGESDIVKNPNCAKKPPTIQSQGDISYIVYYPDSVNAGDLSHPEVGLVRISYQCIYENGKVTTVGVQTGNTFRPFTETDAHGTLGEHHDYLSCFGSKRVVKKQRANYSDIESPLSDNEDFGSDDGDLSGASENSCFVCACCSALNVLAPLLEKCVSFLVGKDVLLLEEKHYSIKAMFQHANDAFGFRLKIMRLVCVLLLWGAVSSIFSPVSTVLSFIPLIGGLASGLFSLVTFLLAMVLATLIWATSWTAFHPEFLGVLLLTIGAVCSFATTTTAGWVIFGYVSMVASIFPFAIMIFNWREDARFAAEQEKLDEGINASETSSLVANQV